MIKKLKQLPSPLPEDIWQHILPHVRNPIPPPLSRPPRSALRQPHLVRMMKVSKHFKTICQPLLYAHILTDDLPLLINSNSTGSRETGKRNLDLVKTLMIEYSAKERHPDRTYEEIFAADGVGWAYFGRTAEMNRVRLLKACEHEMRRLEACVSVLRKTGMANILPALRSMAIASRYGYESTVWDASAWGLYDSARSLFGDSDRRETIALHLRDFLAAGTGFRHFCLRDTLGPLTLSDDSLPSGNPFHSTFHFGSEGGKLPIILGMPTQWSYEGDSSQEWSLLLEYLGLRLLSITKRLDSSPTADIDLHITCSTSEYGPSSFDPCYALFRDVNWDTINPFLPPQFQTPAYDTTRELSADEQRDRAAQLETELRIMLEKRTISGPGSGSTATWQSSLDSPACMACGWGMTQ